MTTDPTRCGWAGQTCTRPAIVQTWQTDTDYPGIVTLDRPLCAYHVKLEVEVDQQLGSPTSVLHIASLNTEVTR